MADSVRISHFSDILCVWAYVSQIRLDELKAQQGDKVDIGYHFINLFGCSAERIGEGWRDRGGYAGFGDHVLEVCGGFPHIEVGPEVWRAAAPASSGMSHLFLKAIQLMEERGEISAESSPQCKDRSLSEEAAWRVRLAFFRDVRDIAQLSVLMEVADQLSLPVASIEEKLRNGEAMAALCRDLELKDIHRVEGSPTYLLNEGRQRLYGNVGYRIIEANVVELLDQPEGQASWC